MREFDQDGTTFERAKPMNAKEALNRILIDPKYAAEKQKLIERLKESRRQLDEGEYVEFDEEGLRRFFDGLKERASRRSRDV
jgi:hypothetical protein